MNRQTAPEIKAIESLKTGFPEADMNLFCIYSEEGVFKLEIVFPSAGYGMIQDKFSGIYAMDLLLSGTATQTAHQIADAIDELGGFVFTNCDYYTASVTVYGMNDKLSQILKIVKSSLDQCVFNQEELNIYKGKKISELNINLGKTNFLSNRRINQMLFGSSHRFALASTEERIRETTPLMLSEYRIKHLNNPYFIFTGSSELPIRQILEDCGFETSFMHNPETTDPLPQGESLDALVDKKGSTQNALRLGKILPGRNHPDFFTMSLFNLILGGYFGSRLMKNIREEKGLTYGIHSGITPFKTFSVFKISSECNQALTAEVRQEIDKEIRMLQEEPVGMEELTVAKNYLSGALLRNFDGAFNISERFKSFLELDTPADYYQHYFEAIKAIGPEDIRRCANNYFDLKTLQYCIAGEM